MQTDAVVVEGVSKSFRGGRDKVLRGVSIKFEKGTLTYILGSSGAGKSVLLRHIMGLVKPDSGRVMVAGRDFSQLTGRQLSVHRKVFGVLFQNSALFDDMTIFDNVAFPLREHRELNAREIRDRVVRVLTQIGIAQGHDKYPNELSGGMRKRVGLARAIVLEPSILLYDEPTTGLDPVTRVMVDELIAQLKSELKLTSIVISHDIPSALLLADRIAFLHQGEIAFLGTPEEFKKSSHPAIRQFLLADVRAARSLQGVPLDG